MANIVFCAPDFPNQCCFSTSFSAKSQCASMNDWNSVCVSVTDNCCDLLYFTCWVELCLYTDRQTLKQQIFGGSCRVTLVVAFVFFPKILGSGGDL